MILSVVFYGLIWCSGLFVLLPDVLVYFFIGFVFNNSCNVFCLFLFGLLVWSAMTMMTTMVDDDRGATGHDDGDGDDGDDDDGDGDDAWLQGLRTHIGKNRALSRAHGRGPGEKKRHVFSWRTFHAKRATRGGRNSRALRYTRTRLISPTLRPQTLSLTVLSPVPAPTSSGQDKDSLEGSLQLLVAGEMLTVSPNARLGLGGWGGGTHFIPSRIRPSRHYNAGTEHAGFLADQADIACTKCEAP